MSEDPSVDEVPEKNYDFKINNMLGNLFEDPLVNYAYNNMIIMKNDTISPTKTRHKLSEWLLKKFPRRGPTGFSDSLRRINNLLDSIWLVGFGGLTPYFWYVHHQTIMKLIFISTISSGVLDQYNNMVSSIRYSVKRLYSCIEEKCTEEFFSDGVDEDDELCEKISAIYLYSTQSA